MVDRFGAAEPVLPLVDLSGIAAGDALAQAWPKTDCIVGNPPFHGSQQIRATLGDAYVEWLKTTFQIGVKDYCVYWFRKAHEYLTADQRAGLVGTNSISQNRARGASLEYIATNGGVITDAISTQDWPGEAGVDVSLVNWIKTPSSPPAEFVLDGKPVAGITPELRTPDRSTGLAVNLAANKGRCFQGPIPAGAGFVITADEAEALLARTEIDYRTVVRPYLVGEDLADDPKQQPRRWVIDFAKWPLETAMRYPAALEIVRERVKPIRETNNRAAYRHYWWQFAEARREMRTALEGLERYIAGIRVGKRLLFAWCQPWTLPSDLTNVFAFDDDYAMGILSSSAHGAWAKSRSSTLEDRLRYTPSTVFASFPWPYPLSAEQREGIGAISASIIKRRQEICAASAIGLTALYNQVDEGAYADLKALHRKLDEAVAEAYGWPQAAAYNSDAIVQRLLELNRAIAAGTRAYDPFGTQAVTTAEMFLLGWGREGFTWRVRPSPSEEAFLARRDACVNRAFEGFLGAGAVAPCGQDRVPDRDGAAGGAAAVG
jgi:hypothetical protein